MSDSAYTVTQETGKVAWYSHLFKNFPHFIVIHTIKSFSVVNGTEVDVFLEFFWFLYDPTNVAIRSLVPLSFLNPACTSGSSQFIYCWSLAWRILSITLLPCEVRAIPFSRGSAWTRDCRIAGRFFIFTTRHIHSWEFLLWPSLFIHPGATSNCPLLFPSSILDTFWAGRLICQCHVFWPSHRKEIGVACHSFLQWTTFYQNFPLWPICLGWPCMVEIRYRVLFNSAGMLLYCNYYLINFHAQCNSILLSLIVNTQVLKISFIHTFCHLSSKVLPSRTL